MSDEIIYQKQFLKMTRRELIAKLKETLSDSRYQHILRVEKTALKLAQKYDVDLEKTSVAALCHDYAKQRSDEEFKQVILAKDLDNDLLNYGNAIWHGVVGAEIVKDELGVTDEEILDAIRFHTTGAAEMSKLAQIIYMADYIEPGRDFKGVKKAREITKRDLGAGVAYQTKHTLLYLIKKNAPVHPQTLVTYNAWVPRYGKEID